MPVIDIRVTQYEHRTTAEVYTDIRVHFGVLWQSYSRQTNLTDRVIRFMRYNRKWRELSDVGVG